MTIDLESNKESRAKAIAEAMEHYEFETTEKMSKRAIKFEKDADGREVIIVVDFTQPSYKKRLFVYDVINKVVLSEHHVAHGVNSSNPKKRAYAISFSNKEGSKKSSLGSFKTAEVYRGKHGKSLRIDGLDVGVNDNVRRRYVVIHPADYVTNGYIKSMGRAGQSDGCFAIDPAISSRFIDMIKNGCFLYAYYEGDKE